MTNDLITPRSDYLPQPHDALPVAEVDKLTASARTITEALRQRTPLPANAAKTAAEVGRWMQPATREHIRHILTQHCGIWGTRQDLETLLTTGVVFIEAEHPSVLAVYSAMNALVRPLPGREPSFANGFQDTPPQPRRFAPTLSEAIYEISAHQGKWADRWSVLKALPTQGD